jgi:hypothetical protein
MTEERGLSIAHTTIMRWVHHYAPGFERRWNRFAQPAGASWRVDETESISIRGVSRVGRRFMRPDYRLPAHPLRDTPRILPPTTGAYWFCDVFSVQEFRVPISSGLI